MLELINVVNFDDSGAFMTRPAEPPTSNDGHEHGAGHQDYQQHSLDSSLGSSNGSGSAASSSSSSSSASVSRPDAPPSFESFLAMPRDFMAAHALHSATEATLLLDIAGVAIEMNTIIECALEQIHDRQHVTRQLTATQDQEPHSGASLATTLVVLLRQATMSNTKTLTALLERLQACVDRLSYLKYPLAQCIEANAISAHDLHIHNSSIAHSRRLLAQAEEGLLRRLESLLDPKAEFKMTPFVVPRWKLRAGRGAGAQVCWPASSSFMASTNSPYRAQDDVRLSSSASSSSSLVSLSSSTTGTSLPPTTPIHERNETVHDSHSHSQSPSKSSSGSSKQQQNGSNSNDSSSSSRQHSQPKM